MKKSFVVILSLLFLFTHNLFAQECRIDSNPIPPIQGMVCEKSVNYKNKAIFYSLVEVKDSLIIWIEDEDVYRRIVQVGDSCILKMKNNQIIKLINIQKSVNQIHSGRPTFSSSSQSEGHHWRYTFYSIGGMGNMLGVVDKDSFSSEEISPFNCHERGSIDLCYERICTSFDASVTMTRTSNESELSALHPDLLKLLEKKGILLSRETFTAFLCDSLRVNSNRTVDCIWELLMNEDQDITGSGHLLIFFSFLLSLTNSVETASENSSCTVSNLNAQLLVDAVMRQNADRNSCERSAPTLKLMDILSAFCLITASTNS